MWSGLYILRFPEIVELGRPWIRGGLSESIAMLRARRRDAARPCDGARLSKTKALVPWRGRQMPLITSATSICSSPGSAPVRWGVRRRRVRRRGRGVGGSSIAKTMVVVCPRRFDRDGGQPRGIADGQKRSRGRLEVGLGWRRRPFRWSRACPWRTPRIIHACQANQLSFRARNAVLGLYTHDKLSHIFSGRRVPLLPGTKKMDSSCSTWLGAMDSPRFVYAVLLYISGALQTCRRLLDRQLVGLEVR